MVALDAQRVEPPPDPAKKLKSILLPNLGKNFEFLAGYGDYENGGYPTLTPEKDVKPLGSKEFANFFGVTENSFSNWKTYYNAEKQTYFAAPYEFERAIALRYGFGPTAQFEQAHLGRDPLDLCKLWLSENWPGWREGDPAEFRDAMTKALRDGSIRPLPSAHPLLLAAVAEVSRAMAARGGRRRQAPLGTPTSPTEACQAEAEPAWRMPPPATNLLEDLVFMSAILSQEDGTLQVSLNTSIARLVEGPPYLWRLRSARLRLQGVSLNRPLGWHGGAKRIEALGDSGGKAEILSAPPAASLVWRLTDLDLNSLGASFEAVVFGEFVGAVGPDAVLTIEVAPSDLAPADPGEEAPSAKQMHLNQAVLQALLGPELMQGRYATVCSQPLGGDHG